MRRRTKKYVDRKIFTRTAKRIEKKNLLPLNMRGGIRL